MEYRNSDRLRELLKGFPELAGRDTFDFETEQFLAFVREAQGQHPEESAHEIRDRAAYRCLTLDSVIDRPYASTDRSVCQCDLTQVEKHLAAFAVLLRTAILVGVLILIAMVLKGHAQNVNGARSTASAPTYTEGDRVPLSTDLSGNLRVNASVSATVNTNGLAISTAVGASTAGMPLTPVGGFVSTSSPSFTNGTVAPLSLTTNGELRVNAAVSATVLTTGLATSANQTMEITHLSSLAGTVQGTAINVNFLTSTITTTISGGVLNVNFLTANIAHNLTQVAGNAVLTAPGTAGVQKVSIVDSNGNPILGTDVVTVNFQTASILTTSTISGNVNVNFLTANIAQNLTQVGGNSVVTGGANGLLAVGGSTTIGGTLSGNAIAIAVVSNSVVRSLSVDANGFLNVNIGGSSGSTVAVNQTQVNSQTIATNGAGVQAVAGATSAGLIIQGQGAGGAPVNVQFLTATIPVSIGSTINVNFLTANIAQNLTQVGGNSVVTGGANGLIAVGGPTTNGSTLTGNPVAIAVVSGSTVRNLSVDANGFLNVNATVNVSATTNNVNIVQVAGSAVLTAPGTAGVQKVSIVDSNGNPILGTDVVTVNFQTANIATNLAQIGANTVVTGGANGLLAVGGTTTSGSTLSGNPITIAVVSNNVVRNLSVDANGFLNVTASPSATVVTDSSGRQIVVGAATSGNTTQGAPVLVGGVTGTQVRTLSVDNNGFLNVNASVSVSSGTSNLVQINSQTIATNGAGVQAVAGATSAGLIIQGQGAGGAPVNVQFLTATIPVSIGSTINVNFLTANIANNLAQVGGNTVVTGGANGLLAVAGATTIGGTLSGNAIAIAVVSNSVVRSLSVDANGFLNVNATVNSGPTNLTQINTQTVVTAGANGLLAVGGSTTSGSTLSGNPITIAVVSNNVVRNLSVDANGFLNVTASPSTTVLTDASGRQMVVGANTSGSTSDAYPILVGALSGTTIRSLVMTTVTSALQTDVTSVAGTAISTAAAGIMKVGVTDGSGNAITSTASALDVNIKSSGVSLNVNFLTANVATNLTQVGGNTLLTGGSNGSIGVGGLAASAASSVGNPVMVGGATGGTTYTISADVAGHIVNHRPPGLPVRTGGLSGTVVTIVALSGAILDSYYCFNPGSSTAYVQLFDGGAVTLGTTTANWVMGVPAGGGANLSDVNWLANNGLKVAATTTTSGSTAVNPALECNWTYFAK